MLLLFFLIKFINYISGKKQLINTCDLLIVESIYLKLDVGFLLFYANETKCKQQYYPTTGRQSVLQTLIKSVHAQKAIT